MNEQLTESKLLVFAWSSNASNINVNLMIIWIKSTKKLLEGRTILFFELIKNMFKTYHKSMDYV